MISFSTTFWDFCWTSHSAHSTFNYMIISTTYTSAWFENGYMTPSNLIRLGIWRPFERRTQKEGHYLQIHGIYLLIRYIQYETVQPHNNTGLQWTQGHLSWKSPAPKGADMKPVTTGFPKKEFEMIYANEDPGVNLSENAAWSESPLPHDLIWFSWRGNMLFLNWENTDISSVHSLKCRRLPPFYTCCRRILQLCRHRDLCSILRHV